MGKKSSLTKPKISICIPTYNRADLIGMTLQCVASQTVKPDEVLILDNASTDNTEQIVRKFNTYGFKYIRNRKNIGMAGNYNRCIEQASNEFLTFLPSDDLIAPTWYQRWQSVIAKHNASLYTSPIIVVNNDLEPLFAFPLFSRSTMVRQPRVLPEFNRRFCPGLPPSAASIYKKSIFDSVPLFDPQEGSECDVRMGMELFDRCDVYYYHRFLFAFRDHEVRSFDKKKGTRSAEISQKLDNYFQIVSEFYTNRYNRDKSSRFVIQTHIFMTLCNINLYIVKGDFGTIQRAYRSARTYFPDLFMQISDYRAFIRIQLELVRRGVMKGKIPKNIKNQIKWLSTVTS